jgi:hypothetical protein
MDIGGLADELSAGTGLLAASGVPERIKEDGSLPLLLALRAAAGVSQRRP